VTHCAAANDNQTKTLVTEVWPWVDASVYSFIPLLVIVTLNSLIVRHVVSARRIRRQLASMRSTSTAGNNQQRLAAQMADQLSSVAVATAALGGSSQPSRSTPHGKCEQLHGQDARMIALLLTVSFTFLAATLPRCATLIATEFINRSLKAAQANADNNPVLIKEYQATRARVYGSVPLALAATDLLMYANHAVNFFLYCATGQKFRHQLCAVAFLVIGQSWRRSASSRLNVGGAVTESVGLRRRRVQRSANIQNNDDSCISHKSVNRHTAI